MFRTNKHRVPKHIFEPPNNLIKTHHAYNELTAANRRAKTMWSAVSSSMGGPCAVGSQHGALLAPPTWLQPSIDERRHH